MADRPMSFWQKINVIERIRNLKRSLQALEHESALQREHLQRLTSMVIRFRQPIVQPSSGRPEPRPPAGSRPIPLSDALASLKREAPHAFALWQDTFENGRRAYEGFPLDSCSMPGHSVACMFKEFIRPYVRGRVLDVGCGPQPIPVYLEGVPLENLYGLDPLSNAGDHPFHFAQGVAECLPWEDKQMSTIIYASSLDHVLLPDRALAEARRALEDGGWLLAWVDLVEDCPPYDPHSDRIQPFDRFHLFKWNRKWFERTLRSRFRLHEHYDLMQGSGSFYAAQAVAP